MTPELPLAYRWFRANGIRQMIPWHFHDAGEGERINRQFRIESMDDREVLTFTHRQDRDDFAGFLCHGDVVTERVIYFHPAFSDQKHTGLVLGEYDDFWSFLREVVIPDTAEWGTAEDLEELLNGDGNDR
jgi:hypothetical protein